jgi:hypothetical protein
LVEFDRFAEEEIARLPGRSDKIRGFWEMALINDLVPINARTGGNE